jgi:hypothetical protein
VSIAYAVNWSLSPLTAVMQAFAVLCGDVFAIVSDTIAHQHHYGFLCVQVNPEELRAVCVGAQRETLDSSLIVASEAATGRAAL